MKTLFLTFFFCILVAFCVLAGIIVAQIPPRTWSFENLEIHALDLAEKALTQASKLAGDKVDEWAAEKYGRCQPLAPLPTVAPDPIGNVAPVGGPAPFAEPIELKTNSILCGFPSAGKSVLLIPNSPEKVILRRRPGGPGMLEFLGEGNSGMLLLSDELNFDLNLPGMILHLQSKGPVSIMLDYSKEERRLNVIAQKGALEFSFTPLTSISAPTLVTFNPGVQGTLASQGKLFKPKESVRILPTGVYVDMESEPYSSSTVSPPFLLASLFSSLPPDESGTPRRSSFTTFTTALFDRGTREGTLSLATHFPSLFPIRFLCGFTEAKGKRLAVLPGEWIDSPAGGLLECPGGYKVELTKGTRMRVLQAGTIPDFVVATGKIDVTVGATDFFFSTPAFTGGLRGQAKTQRFLISASPKENSLLCVGGNVKMSIRRTYLAGSTTLLSSLDCRMDVFSGLEGLPRTLFPYDHVSIENLGVPRWSWPQSPPPKTPVPISGSEKFMSIALTSRPGGELHWQLPQHMVNADCTVLFQKSDFSPVTELSKFKGAAEGERKLEASTLPGFASILCENENALSISPLVFLEKTATPAAK